MCLVFGDWISDLCIPDLCIPDFMSAFKTLVFDVCFFVTDLWYADKWAGRFSVSLMVARTTHSHIEYKLPRTEKVFVGMVNW